MFHYHDSRDCRQCNWKHESLLVDITHSSVHAADINISHQQTPDQHYIDIEVADIENLFVALWLPVLFRNVRARSHAKCWHLPDVTILLHIDIRFRPGTMCRRHIHNVCVCANAQASGFHCILMILPLQPLLMCYMTFGYASGLYHQHRK